MSEISLAKLGQVAAINPRLEKRPGPNELVSFIPMAAVDAETGSTTSGVDRRFSEVQKGYTIFENGDVLLAKITPCFENGKIAQANLRRDVGAGSTEFHVIRPHAARLDNRYLLHFLRQPYIRAAGARRMVGSAGQRRVPQAFVEELEIPLFPLEEQRRIAEVLDRADELRAKRRQALAHLDNLTQAIFYDMFGDSLSNPKQWKVTHLGKVADFFPGASLPVGEPYDSQRDGYFLVKVSDLNLAENETAITTCQSWSAQPGTKSATCPTGSVVIPKRGGAIGTNKKRITVRPCVLDPNLMGIWPHPQKVNLAYLYQWFLNFDLSTLVSGSSVPQLNKRDLDPLPLPLPPMSLQMEFSRRARAVEKQKTAHRASLSKLDALFASLQDRAFKGLL